MLPVKYDPRAALSTGWAILIFFTSACVGVSVPDTAGRAGDQLLGVEEALDQLEPLELAITVDDLPAHGDAQPGMTRLDIATEMINALQAAGSPPVYGFSNGKAIEWDSANLNVLRLWRHAGFLLGNHTYSHSDLTQVPVEEFLADVEKMDQVLGPLVAESQMEKLFRFPYLSEGNTHDKRRRVREYLNKNGYRIAPVTVNYNDWAWSAAYTRCSVQHDEEAVRRLRKQVVTAARLNLLHAQRLAKFLLGRDIKHILLLHISAFTARSLPDILAAFKAEGVRLISLSTALSDPAYGIDPNQLVPHDMTFLTQLSMLYKVEDFHVQNFLRSSQVDTRLNLCMPQ